MTRRLITVLLFLSSIFGTPDASATKRPSPGEFLVLPTGIVCPAGKTVFKTQIDRIHFFPHPLKDIDGFDELRGNKSQSFYMFLARMIPNPLPSSVLYAGTQSSCERSGWIFTIWMAA